MTSDGRRYVLFEEIAAGGMATVHLGRLFGAVGFARTVAIKQMHAHFAKDAGFVAMFVDEARLAARIQHPNIAAILDIVAQNQHLLLVMEYLHGASLAHLSRAVERAGERVPYPIAVGILTGVLAGLHAAHEATNEQGEPLCLVHRDVSPENVMVGIDGLPRVLDFGVAKAVGRLQTTEAGTVKGKPAYMAPEQLRGGDVDRRTDVYAASVVLWQMLAGRRLFEADSVQATMMLVLEQKVAPPSHFDAAIPGVLDDIVMRGLSRDRGRRYATAREMADALEAAVAPATPRAIGLWVESLAGDELALRAARIAEIESKKEIQLPHPESEKVRAVLSGERASLEFYATEASAPVPPVSPASIIRHPPLLDAGSERSGVSLSAAGIPRPRPRRAVVLGGFVALAAIGAAAVFVGATKRATPTANTATEIARTASSAAGAPPASAPPAASSAVSVSTAVAPSAPLAAVPVDSKGRRGPPRPRGLGSPAAPPSALSGNPRDPACAEPFTIDAQGVRIPKLECLKER